MNNCRLFFFTLLVAALVPAHGFGATKIQPLFSGAGADPAWVPLVLTVDVPAPGGVLWIRDARGGLEIGRAVDAGNGRRVVVSLPFVLPESTRDSSGLNWRVRVRMTRMDSADVLAGPEILAIEHAPELRDDSPLRVASAEGRGLADAAVLTPLAGKRGVSLGALAEDDILAAPALALAGTDVIALDSRLAKALTPERAAELFAVGIRLVYVGTLPPPGALSKLQWTQRAGFWLAPLDWSEAEPSKSLTPPAVVDGNLAEIRAEEPQSPAALSNTALLVTPAVVLLIVLVRAFTSRPLIMAIALAVIVTGGTVILLRTLRPAVLPAVQELSWTTRCAPGNLAVHETVALQTTLFPANLNLAGSAPVFSLPVTESAGGYFALAESHHRLLLSPQGSRLFATLEPRRTRAFLTRTVEIACPLPEADTDPAWIRDLPQHHLSLASSTRYRPGTSRPLNSWINEQNPAVVPSLKAWYALRFWGNRSFNLLPLPALTAIDFGSVPPATLAATPITTPATTLTAPQTAP